MTLSPVVKQFITFSFVGASNTIIDIIIYVILTRGFSFWAEHTILANVVAFIIATSNSYYLNKRVTFKPSGGNEATAVIKFFLITGSGFLIYTLCFIFLTNLGWYDLLAKSVLIIVVLFWNFTMTKFWAFAERPR